MMQTLNLQKAALDEKRQQEEVLREQEKKFVVSKQQWAK